MVRLWNALKNLKREVLAPIALFSFLTFLSVQIFYWREFAFDATLIQARNIVVQDFEKYHLELGAICNTIEHFDCSKRHFGELVNKNPYHRQALANLAIATARLEEWDEAKTKIESYFSIGGSAADVMYWYARTLEQLDGLESGLRWYYESLATTPQNQYVLERLVSVLLQLKRFNEAASAIASVYQGVLNEGSPAYELFEQSMNLWESHSFHVKDELILPSFFENQIYSSIRLSANSRWRVAILNFDFEHVVVNEDLLSEALLRAPAEVNKKSTVQTPFGAFEIVQMELPEIQLLGMTLKGLKVKVCKACPSIVGRPILDAFQRSNSQKGAVKYVSLKE